MFQSKKKEKDKDKKKKKKGDKEDEKDKDKKDEDEKEEGKGEDGEKEKEKEKETPPPKKKVSRNQFQVSLFSSCSLVDCSALKWSDTQKVMCRISDIIIITIFLVVEPFVKDHPH